jgi:hypothetical protein
MSVCIAAAQGITVAATMEADMKKIHEQRFDRHLLPRPRTQLIDYHFDHGPLAGERSPLGKWQKLADRLSEEETDSATRTAA